MKQGSSLTAFGASATGIPGDDAEFNAWLDNFVTYANANLPR